MDEEREAGLLLPLRRASRRLTFLDGVPGSMEEGVKVVAGSKPAAPRRGRGAALTHNKGSVRQQGTSHSEYA